MLTGTAALVVALLVILGALVIAGSQVESRLAPKGRVGPIPTWWLNMQSPGPLGSRCFIGQAEDAPEVPCPSGSPREQAWASVHLAVADMPGWAVGPCEFDAEAALWYVSAIDLRPQGWQATREALTGSGASEVEALRALVARIEDRLSRE